MDEDPELPAQRELDDGLVLAAPELAQASSYWISLRWSPVD
jgi:hypothetical protein